MSEPAGEGASRLRRALRGVRVLGRIPPVVVVLLAVVVAVGMIVASVYMYRAYQYVEHDNQFCLSCHLMADPFDRFAQSAHRGLGCKACHQPTFSTRSQMALTQILEQPDTLITHAEVPNERCADCHIRGDPETWRLISASGGHRIHMESDNPSLQGLQCVQCHSSGIHEFAATDRTCAQSGCHEDTSVRLGRMGGMTIHCAACHDFSRPVPTAAPVDTLLVALRPRREECLSCHAMRLLVAEFPQDDPHQAACGACHDPHRQTTPAAAVESCTAAGCHASPETLSPMHRGLPTGALGECTTCHFAHDFHVRGSACLDCHRDIYQDDVAASDVPGAGFLHLIQEPRLRDEPLRFSHARHRGVECTACHSTTDSHGAVTVTSVRDCRQCHHTSPVADRCTACHDPAEIGARRSQVPQTIRLSAGPAESRRRSLPFDHSEHGGVACRQCHTTGLTLSASGVQCAACHREHHRPTARCRACHVQAPANAHTIGVHVSCTGAGCHTSPPIQGVPRTREFCLACHQDLVDHVPGRNCSDCHILPPPHGGSASGTTPS